MSDKPASDSKAAAPRGSNLKTVAKLGLMAVVMFGFAYALVPIYRSVCAALGTGVLTLADGSDAPPSPNAHYPVNSQVDMSRTIHVEFDANARGPWEFHPAVRHVEVHPGELTTVMYEFRNRQNRRMSAQAIPSYAPLEAASHFHKLECFCFHEWTLGAGESKTWPVVFVVDPKLPKYVKTITLSYTFFGVAGTGVGAQESPAAPGTSPTPHEGGPANGLQAQALAPKGGT